MKKLFVLMMASMLCTTTFAQRSAQAQGGGRSAKPGLAQKKHAFFMGFKGGVDFTSMTQPEECNLYDGSGLGYSGGIAFKGRFGQATPNAPAGTGIIGAGIEVKYKLNTVKTIGTDESGQSNAKLSVGYLEVPVYVQLFPFYKSDAMNTLYIEVGPDFAGTLSRKPQLLRVDNPSGAYSSVTYNIDNNGSTLKGMDVRLMAGVGYDFPIKNNKQETTNLIGINARYYMGTSKLAKNFNSKMNTLEISLSWMFNIGKL